MPLFVEQILQAEVSLVHLMSGVGSRLLVCASGCIGGAIERLQTGEEGARTEMNRVGIVVEVGGGDEVAKVVDDGVGGGREDNGVRSSEFVEGHGGRRLWEGITEGRRFGQDRAGHEMGCIISLAEITTSITRLARSAGAPISQLEHVPLTLPVCISASCSLSITSLTHHPPDRTEMANRPRAMSGTIPSMEAAHDQLTENTIIIGACDASFGSSPLV